MKKNLLAGLGIMVLTIIHHLYGALIYDAPFRLHVAYFAVPVIILLWITYWLSSKFAGTFAGRALMVIFLLIAVIIPIGIIGLYEGGYNHLVKNIAYFSGASAETMKQLYPSDLYEMPSDFWFEATGILQCVAGLYAVSLLPWRRKQFAR